MARVFGHFRILDGTNVCPELVKSMVSVREGPVRQSVRMPSELKLGDVVFYGDPSLSYFVEDVDYEAKTADIKDHGGRCSGPPERSVVRANFT